MFDLQFQYPQALYLLAVLPLLLFFFLRHQWKKKKAVKRIGDPKLVKELYRSHSPAKSIIKFSLLFIAFALGCIALANPRKPEEGGGDLRKGIDMVIALDVSNSMLSTDVAPDRLTRAKQFINQLIKKTPENRICLLVFAGHAYVQMPFTYDHKAAQMFVEAATPALVAAQGTAITEALDKAQVAFSVSDERYKAITLISDGETHDEQAIQKAMELAGEGIMINTVGVGSEQGGNIPLNATGELKKDASGNTVLTKINEQSLMEIAAATKGSYVRLESAEGAVGQIEQALANAEKKAFVDLALLNYETYFWVLALPMLLLLLIEIFLPDRKKVVA